MNDAQKFAYRIQGTLAFFLPGAVIGLLFVVLFRELHLTEANQALLNTALGAVIAWAGLSVNFWLARHRPQQPTDSDISNPTSTETKV